MDITSSEGEIKKQVPLNSNAVIICNKSHSKINQNDSVESIKLFLEESQEESQIKIQDDANNYAIESNKVVNDEVIHDNKLFVDENIKTNKFFEVEARYKLDKQINKTFSLNNSTVASTETLQNCSISYINNLPKEYKINFNNDKYMTKENASVDVKLNETTPHNESNSLVHKIDENYSSDIHLEQSTLDGKLDKANIANDRISINLNTYNADNRLEKAKLPNDQSMSATMNSNICSETASFSYNTETLTTQNNTPCVSTELFQNDKMQVPDTHSLSLKRNFQDNDLFVLNNFDNNLNKEGCDEILQKFNDCKMISDDMPESSNRKRKIEKEILESVKCKRKSNEDEDEIGKTDSSQIFELEYGSIDSSSLSLKIPETSLDTSNSKSLINGENSTLLNTFDNGLASSNLLAHKDESDVANFSGNETPELQKFDSLFLNNSEGMNVDGNSSPDQGPTYELISRFDDNSGIVSLIINRTDKKYLDYNADWSQNSSPGSVTSTGVFQLSEHKRISTMSSSTTSSAYSSKTNDNFIIPAVPIKKIDKEIHKQGIRGHKELFILIKDIFRTTYNDLNSDDFDEKFNEGSEQKMNFEKANNEHSTNNILADQYKLINSPETITNDASPKSTSHADKIKNASHLRSVSSRRNSNDFSSVSDIEQKDSRLNYRVLARWVDKKYYAGKIIDIKDNNKFIVRFDDNHTKTLLQDYIVFGEKNILPLQGQSVYALFDNEEEYVPGIVTSITENEDGVHYSVESDNGTTGSIKASDIYLTEDQAKAIKEIHLKLTIQQSANTPKKTNCQDLSLDNIIHGPRNRRQVFKPVTPIAGSSGLNKFRHNTSRRSKQRYFSESSDRTITEPPSPASTTECEEALSAKGPIEEVPGVEPEVQKTPKKITGVLTGPFPVKGCGRLSGRRTSKVTGCLYDNTDVETVELLGPIPTTKIFVKKCFILTCTENVSSKLKSARLATIEASGTDSEYSTDAENCTVPFMKERLKCQLEAGGGIVYSHFEEIPHSKYRSCTLIAQRVCHTAKYIQCLASNIKAVLHTWVIDCCKSEKLLPRYDLPAGWSIERKCYVRYQIGKELYMRLSSNPFNDFLILLYSDNTNFLKFWGRVCKSAGASIKVIENEDTDITVGSVIVTDSECPLKVRKQAQNLDIPLVSTTWVVQSLIIGQVCNYGNNIKYAHNYVEID